MLRLMERSEGSVQRLFIAVRVRLADPGLVWLPSWGQMWTLGLPSRTPNSWIPWAG